jgi:hypothetical protein
MRCIVDGAEIAAESLTRRGMNYGQDCPGLHALAYCIELTRAEFVGAVCDLYEEYLEDTIASQAHGDLDFEEVSELRELGWPRFDAMLAEHAGLLLRITKEFLEMDLLDRLLPEPVSTIKAPAYSINNVNRLEQAGETFRILGEAYPLDVERLRSPAGSSRPGVS